MSSLRIKKVQLRNWLSVRDATVEFPDNGVVHVLGKNLTNNGKFESIASGKTALGEALIRAISGTEGRYTHIRDYSTDGKGNMLVVVDGTLGDTPIKIELGYRCEELSDVGEGLRFTYGDKVIQRGHIRDTRTEISQALGIQQNLSRWAIYIDGDHLRFSDLKQKDAVDLLMNSLNQPPWTQYHDNAKKTLLNFKKDLENAESKQRETSAALNDARCDLKEAKEELKSAIQKYDKAETERNDKIRSIKTTISDSEEKIVELEKRQKEIKKSIEKETERGAERYKELEIARKHAQSMVARSTRFKLRLAEKRSTARERLDRAKEKLSDLEGQPKNCPTCGKAWDKHASKKEIDEATELVEKRRLRVQKLKSLYEKTSYDEEKYQKQQDEADSSIARTRSENRTKRFSEEYDDVSTSIKSLNQFISRSMSDIDECRVNPYEKSKNSLEAVVQERAKNLERAQERLEKAAGDLVAVQESTKIVQYWTEAFSPYGIPNTVLKEAIAPLNNISRRLSSAITGGILSINYSTSRELASGKEKPELIIRPENTAGASKVEGSSKGEGGLTNLIIAETIAEIGMVAKRVGFRWYDEVVSSQDMVVRRSIFSYLKNLAANLGILVFVVDHSAESVNYADHVLIAEKTVENGTRYYWKI